MAYYVRFGQIPPKRHTQFWQLVFKKGDYIVFPRTTIYRFEFAEKGPIRL